MKYYERYHVIVTIKININMRCIEILAPLVVNEYVRRININMRCIEMRYRNAFINTVNRLTLT